MTAAMASLTAKSPSAQVIQGRPVAAKAIEKKRAVSTTEASAEETSGARHQACSRSRLNTATSSSCAIRKAVLDAMAMRGVASQADSTTASAKPTQITRRAALGPSARLGRRSAANTAELQTQTA